MRELIWLISTKNKSKDQVVKEAMDSYQKYLDAQTISDNKDLWSEFIEVLSKMDMPQDLKDSLIRDLEVHKDDQDLMQKIINLYSGEIARDLEPDNES